MLTDLFQLEQKPVTVFSSGDAGAPKLLKSSGSLKSLLEACLVTGYGDKTALGWEMVHESEDRNSASFLSTDDTSSKCVLKIDGSTTTKAKISAYESMSALGEGVNPFGLNNLYSTYDSGWRLIGHSKAFILLVDVEIYGSRTALPLIFGDIPTEKTRTKPVCIFWSAKEGSWGSGGVQSTLFAYPNGNTGKAPEGVGSGDTYPMTTNNEGVAYNLTDSFCKFGYRSFSSATALYEPILTTLGDSKWALIPMVQPMSTKISEISNLAEVNATAICARTGQYNQSSSSNDNNNDCAVPINWWYA